MIKFLAGLLVSAAIGALIVVAMGEPKIIGVTAQCHSGHYTTATGQGVCSGHGGIKRRIGND